MDKNDESLITLALEGSILARFPASDLGEVARLSARPELLTHYLAQSNDLTRSEAEEMLAILADRPSLSADCTRLEAA